GGGETHYFFAYRVGSKEGDVPRAGGRGIAQCGHAVISDERDWHAEPPPELVRQIHGDPARFAAGLVLLRQDEVAVVDAGAEFAAWRKVGADCGGDIRH